jgi:hypothetical protein
MTIETVQVAPTSEEYIKTAEMILSGKPEDMEPIQYMANVQMVIAFLFLMSDDREGYDSLASNVYDAMKSIVNDAIPDKKDMN